MTSTSQNISIFHQKIGDFILATPTLKLLETLHPHLRMGVPDPLVELYRENKVFTNIVSQSELHEVLEGESNPEVVDLSHPGLSFPDMPKTWNRLSQLPFQKPQNTARAYHEALKVIFDELPEIFEPLPFLPLDAEVDFLESLGLNPFQYFTFHPGSGAKGKNWPIEKYMEVVKQLRSKFPLVRSIAILGPSEAQVSMTAMSESSVKVIREDLVHVAKVLAGSLLHIDNDSGIHHLAGAIDVPAITIFGATGPGNWASLSKQNHIVWGGKDGLDLVSVQDVVQTAETVLNQYQGFETPQKS